MSQATVCDGCGELSADAVQIGRIRKLDYCACCAPIVDAYERAVTALRLRQAEEFAVEHAKIKAEAEAKCPKLQLPL